MAKPYDATVKYLIETFPRDFLTLVGLGASGPIDLIDTDLSTVTAEADTVIRLGGSEPGLVHFEFQAGHDVRLPSRLFRYNALLDERQALPIRSVAVLLRREADSPNLTGEYRRSAPGLPDYLVFQYNVIRVWREPVAAFLAGGLGLVPLASVANLAGRPIKTVIRAVATRLEEAQPDQKRLLWSATTNLLGLRYPADQVNFLLRGVFEMKESSVYQAALAEGTAIGEARGVLNQARRSVLRPGERRFGSATATDLAHLNRVTDPGRLEEMADLASIAPVASWAEFWDLVGLSDSPN